MRLPPNFKALVGMPLLSQRDPNDPARGYLDIALSAEQAPPFPRILPRAPTRLIGCPVNGDFHLREIRIPDLGKATGAEDSVIPAARGTESCAADWIVNDIEIDGKSQLSQKDLPGALFSPKGVAAARPGFAELKIHGFATVEQGHELAIVVTYVGSHPEGVPFHGWVWGERSPQRSTVIPFSVGEPVPSSAEVIRRMYAEGKTSTEVFSATVRLEVQDVPFQIERLVIGGDKKTRNAADWLVLDLRIDGKSQFIETSRIPGDMFAANAIETFVSLPCIGRTIEVEAIYIGLAASAVLIGRFEGTVVRDNYYIAPPDLRVLMTTGDGGPGEVVIGTCDWRTPPPADGIT